MTVELKSGDVFDAEGVFKSRMYPSLFIYTHAFTMQQAAAIFADPEHIETIIVIDGEKKTKYLGFSELDSISKAEIFTEYPDELFIWLNYSFDSEVK